MSLPFWGMSFKFVNVLRFSKAPTKTADMHAFQPKAHKHKFRTFNKFNVMTNNRCKTNNQSNKSTAMGRRCRPFHCEFCLFLGWDGDVFWCCLRQCCVSLKTVNVLSCFCCYLINILNVLICLGYFIQKLQLPIAVGHISLKFVQTLVNIVRVETN
jgi:hypothetical protein